MKVEEFIKAYKDHEEELQVTNPDFVGRIMALMDKDNLSGNKVGASRYTNNFRTSISRAGPLQCGDMKKKHKKPHVKELEEQLKARLNEKLAEDEQFTKLVAAEEDKILSAIDDDIVVDLDNEISTQGFLSSCEECGHRHSMEERECDICEQVHEGCCYE
tara:strand:+ start:3174 stop:3653 length:480 start_codon:yes stop_codon:yes gene_type:complete